MAKATFTPSQLIVCLTGVNPKRGASAARFDLYFTCGTVGEFIAAGGTRADILWDVAHGYILLDEEVAEQPAETKE